LYLKTYAWQNRLPGAREFSAVMANPPCTRDKFFLVFANKNNLDLSRLGVIVSRKVSKRAVDRNRLKRVVREAFRNKLVPQTDPGNGVDVVVLVRNAACKTENKSLFESLDKHWQVAKDSTE
jgi:ribonuclease P protein component